MKKLFSQLSTKSSTPRDFTLLKILTKKFGLDIFVSPEHQIISADFTSMYTNIPTEKALDLMEKLCDSHYGRVVNNILRIQDGLVPLGSGSMVRKVISFFVCKSGIFSAGDVLYKQNKGLMMGSSLSAVIAALLIEDTLGKVGDDILFVGDSINFGRIH